MIKKIAYPLIIILGFTIATSCDSIEKDKELPVLGRKTAIVKEVKGQLVIDSVEHHIPDFSLISQDSNTISNEDLSGKVYVADFFFTSCPTICPKMKKQMLRIYHEFEGNDKVMLVSHTIDPLHDSVPVLRKYAGKLNVSSDKWLFLTGKRDEIYDLAQTGYFSHAMEDSAAEGGFLHSGFFILIDEKGRVRGSYNGTDPVSVDVLMEDINILLNKGN